MNSRIINSFMNQVKAYVDIGIDLVKNTSGAFSLGKIIEVVIALVVIATVLPLGITEFIKAGQTGVLSTGTIHAVWVIAPVLIILGLVLGLIYMAMGKGR